jgi:hypothetical protein
LRLRKIYCVAAALAIVTTGFSIPPDQPLNVVLFEGEPVGIDFAPPQGKERAYALGPWRFGAKLRKPAAGKPDKPHDRRLNLYIVVPGTQNQSAASEFDHNLIINGKPTDPDAEAEFDVYWAIVLDPKLRMDLRQERDLLIAAQEVFVPGDLFEFDDLAGAAFLRAILKKESLADLRVYRKAPGSLPRVIIVPAGFAMRATLRS